MSFFAEAVFFSFWRKKFGESEKFVIYTPSSPGNFAGAKQTMRPTMRNDANIPESSGEILMRAATFVLTGIAPVLPPPFFAFPARCRGDSVPTMFSSKSSGNRAYDAVRACEGGFFRGGGGGGVKRLLAGLSGLSDFAPLALFAPPEAFEPHALLPGI